jgi:two-component system sensor histidine kinase YesM
MKHNVNRSKHDIRMTLQQTTLLLFIILLLFFCFMFMISTSIIRKRTEDDFMIRTSETAVNNVVSTVRATLVNYNYLTRLIMLNDGVVSFLKTKEVDNEKKYEARSGITEVQNLYSYIDSIYIFRNDGEHVNTGYGEFFIDINEIEYSNILAARGTTLASINGNGTIRKGNGNPLLTMSRAIYDINSQECLGILIMNISADVFEDTLALQNSGEMCILDRNGNYLCGNKEIAALYNSDYDSESMVHKKIHIGDERKTLSGKLAVKPLVVICASGEGAEALPQETIYALMLTLIAFILSAMVCAWFVTVNITRPIRNLSSAMESTRSSGWLKKIDTQMPNNEIGRLAESYNSMIEFLNELFHRLLENEKNIQKAEMRVLQEQIKPHFLYNSLETISYMALQESASKAHEALETLGSFYRNFLSKGDREIPLKRELRITQDYLSLQRMRYGDIFEDEYILDDATLDCMVPKLILQPLVENCIYHGVRLKGEKGIIRITTRMEEFGLYIMVYDSGVGMSSEQIKNVLEGSKEYDGKQLSGFGLRGTINRIRYYCDCENVVQIRSEQGEYTEIEIYIPKMRKTNSEGDESCTGL